MLRLIRFPIRAFRLHALIFRTTIRKPCVVVIASMDYFGKSEHCRQHQCELINCVTFHVGRTYAASERSLRQHYTIQIQNIEIFTLHDILNPISVVPNSMKLDYSYVLFLKIENALIARWHTRSQCIVHSGTVIIHTTGWRRG